MGECGKTLAEVTTETDMFDAIEQAVQQAREVHESGTCGDSEWSCSYCEEV